MLSDSNTNGNSMINRRVMLSDSSTNVNSTINRRVSLFYQYLLEAFHHTVCPCTSSSACVVCPGTGELVGQQVSIQPDTGQLDEGSKE